MYDVLHNQRFLSVQFAIEDDGRVWQFIDAVEAAWHAGGHNRISIGAECCLFPNAGANPDYYSERRNTLTGNLPHEIKPERLQGHKYPRIFQMPWPQVDAVCRWTAGLWVALEFFGVVIGGPPRFPHDSQGRIPRRVLKRSLAHKGVLGHLHCTARKWDPAGFPWEYAEELIATYYTFFQTNKKEIFE
jgi:hypothetical protein